MKNTLKITLLLFAFLLGFGEAFSQNDSLLIYLTNGQLKVISFSNIKKTNFEPVITNTNTDSLQIYLTNGQQKTFSLFNVKNINFAPIYTSINSDSLLINLTNGQQKIFSFADIQKTSFEPFYNDSLQVYLTNGQLKTFSLVNIEKAEFGPLIHNFPLKQGWNIISSNYLPDAPAMESVFSSIVDKVVIVKNNNGSAYIPQWEDNQIGSWDITQGYLLYMNTDATLGIFGEEVNPSQTSIILKKGWNIIAYLRNSELACETAFAGLKANNLVIVKNNNGAAYIPQWEDNQIGNLVPGQGYLIYILEDDVLTYPGN
jgi:hypothetical protein